MMLAGWVEISGLLPTIIVLLATAVPTIHALAYRYPIYMNGATRSLQYSGIENLQSLFNHFGCWGDTSVNGTIGLFDDSDPVDSNYRRLDYIRQIYVNQAWIWSTSPNDRESIAFALEWQPKPPSAKYDGDVICEQLKASRAMSDFYWTSATIELGCHVLRRVLTYPITSNKLRHLVGLKRNFNRLRYYATSGSSPLARHVQYVAQPGVAIHVKLMPFDALETAITANQVFLNHIPPASEGSLYQSWPITNISPGSIGLGPKITANGTVIDSPSFSVIFLPASTFGISKFSYTFKSAEGSTSSVGQVLLTLPDRVSASSTFSDNNDGWRIQKSDSSIVSATWIAAANGSTAYIKGGDQESGLWNNSWFFSAPSKFLGSQAHVYGGQIEFSLTSLSNNVGLLAQPPSAVLVYKNVTMIMNFTNSTVNSSNATLQSYTKLVSEWVVPSTALRILPFDFIQLECSSCGITLTQRNVLFSGGTQNYRFVLNELPSSGWIKVNSGTFATQCEFVAVMSSLSAIRISADFTTNVEVVALNTFSQLIGPNEGIPVFCYPGQ